MEKLRINLSTSYGLMLSQCTDHLWSRLEGQDKWEVTPNQWGLLALIKSIKLLSQKYKGDMEYHRVAHYTLLRQFMLLRQGNSSNSEYK